MSQGTRNTWSIYEQDSADVWTLSDTIPRPNENFTISTTSTLINNQLANGSLAFVLPETKYKNDQLEFIWYADTDGTIKSQIEGYVQLGTRFKIIDHLSSEYIGRFTQVSPVWISGISNEFDITAIFTRESD